MGAAKASVSVVTFAEKNDKSSLNDALKESGARGLVFSPSSLVAEGESRSDMLQSLMPELNKLYPGDEITLQ